MSEELRRFTDAEIIRIYNEEYIGQHIGVHSLEKKYNYYNLYYVFDKLGLPRRSNQEKNKVFDCDSDFFDVIDTEEKAYWLGFIYADGYISHPSNNTSSVLRVGISLNDGDAQHLEKFRTAIKSNVPIHHYEVKQGYKPGSMYCRIIISDNKLAQDLIKHGCVEKKSNILEPPINVPEELERHFIRGFMDGNGSISISKAKYGQLYKIRFTSTDSVLQWIMHHLIKHDIIKREYPLYKRKPEHIVSSFEFGGNKLSRQYLNYIYDDATVWLDRKYERYLQLICLQEGIA